MYRPVQADSGWDSDYGSGYGSGSGSGGGISSSGGNLTTTESIVFFTAIFIIFISMYICYRINNNMLKKQKCAIDTMEITKIKRKRKIVIIITIVIIFLCEFIFIKITSGSNAINILAALVVFLVFIDNKKNLLIFIRNLVLIITIFRMLLSTFIYLMDGMNIWNIIKQYWGIYLVIIFILVIISKLIKKYNGNIVDVNKDKRKFNNYNNTIKYQDIDINKIKEIDSELNINEFKTKVFNIYRDIQTAWMNFDTDTIRKLTTDELYNMYSSQLETLKLKKQKNIMKDIELIDVKITDIRKENNIIKINAYLNVRCYDYVIKESTNEVVRGKSNAKINIKYMLTFVKSSSNNEKVEKCPSCGAPIDIISSTGCPYCDSTLVKISSDYVMSKKRSLGQTLEK